MRSPPQPLSRTPRLPGRDGRGCRKTYTGTLNAPDTGARAWP
jgi:hypothetical protein